MFHTYRSGACGHFGINQKCPDYQDVQVMYHLGPQLSVWIVQVLLFEISTLTGLTVLAKNRDKIVNLSCLLTLQLFIL